MIVSNHFIKSDCDFFAYFSIWLEEVGFFRFLWLSLFPEPHPLTNERSGLSCLGQSALGISQVLTNRRKPHFSTQRTQKSTPHKLNAAKKRPHKKGKIFTKYFLGNFEIIFKIILKNRKHTEMKNVEPIPKFSFFFRNLVTSPFLIPLLVLYESYDTKCEFQNYKLNILS